MGVSSTVGGRILVAPRIPVPWGTHPRESLLECETCECDIVSEIPLCYMAEMKEFQRCHSGP